jgi:DNA-binding SARP family transcriptional activator
MMRLQLSLFGPVRARRGDQEITLGSAQRRALLAILALRANQVVTRSDLIDALWGDQAPASASGSIYTYISSLRAALEPERTSGDHTGVLSSGSSGYCLRVDAESIDVVRFESLRERARLCQRANDFPGARAALESALDLAKDDPLAGLPGPYAAIQRARLRELRLELVERRAKILLDEGDHQRVVAELRPFAAAHPRREGLQSLHLLALHRCGHRDEALRLFERVRADILDELGAEPGTELSTRYEQLLADDPALWRQVTNAPRASAAASSSRPAENPAVFAGRRRELAVFRSVTGNLSAGRGASLWFEGEPGIGKSSLISAGLASVAGCTVVRAGADELSRHVPLQTLLDALDVSPASPDPSRRAVGSAVRRLSLDDEAELTAAVDLVVDLVIGLSRERPLLLVFDNLQWADAGSLEVWRRLARVCTGSPLVLIGAGRRVAGNPRLDVLRGDLAAQGAFVRTLEPLPEEAVRELVTGLTGAEPGPALLGLARAAAGNPLLVREIVGALTGGEVPDSPVAEARPAVPPAALETIGRRFGFLSAAASELLRWAALLHERFTHDELAAALGRPSGELDDGLSEVVALGLLARRRGRLAFRHPVVREAFYARTPAAFRAALHRQLAEALADAGAPVERVAFQLLAVSVPVDKWQCEWLARNVRVLAARSPRSAMRLLQRVNAANAVPAGFRDELATAAARITLWLERDPGAGVSPLAARVRDPAAIAELRWLLAWSHLVRGHGTPASEVIREALRDPAIPADWRSVHAILLSRAREGGWSGGTPAPSQATALVPARRTSPAAGPVAAFWQGGWDDALAELTRLLHAGPVLAGRILGRSADLREFSGVAAVIAAHRGRPDDVRAHLMSVWTLAPAGEPDTGGPNFVLAADALLAEMRGDPEHAFALLAGLLEAEDGVACSWLPDLVRLAMGLGEHDQAKAATFLCERTVGREAAALRCRSLLDEDPLVAIEAAARSREAGDRFAAAQATEDAAALFAAAGEPVKAAAALHAALTCYDELDAVLDADRAERRVRQGDHRSRR